MIGYKMACKVYGLRPLTRAEEADLPENEKVIRQCKIDILNMCTEMLNYIEVIEENSKYTEEKDDSEYKDYLAGFRQVVRKATSAVQEAANYWRS